MQMPWRFTGRLAGVTGALLALVVVVGVFLSFTRSADRELDKAAGKPPGAKVRIHSALYSKLRDQHLGPLLPFFDWARQAERVPRELVNRHFARKMQGAMLLLLRHPFELEEFPAIELDYWGIRSGRGSCIATRLRMEHRQVEVHYFPGASIALRAEINQPLRLPEDVEGRDFRLALLELVQRHLRVPYRVFERLDIHTAINRVDGVNVYTGKIVLGQQYFSGPGGDVERFRDRLFDEVQFTLIDSNPGFVGLCVYLPDPDKTGWCKQPWVIRDK